MTIHIRFEGRKVTSLYDDDRRLGFAVEHKGQWLVYDDRTPPPHGQHAPSSVQTTEGDARAALMKFAPPEAAG